MNIQNRNSKIRSAGSQVSKKLQNTLCALTNLTGAKRQFLAIFLGVLTGLALPPIYFIPLCFFSFSVLVLILDKISFSKIEHKTSFWQRARLAGFIGWSFGIGYFVIGLWWLAHAMTVDLAQFGWAIPLTVFGLPAFLACYYGIATFLAFLFWRKGLVRIIILALAFALAEYLRSILFTGFPWNAVGYTAMPSPIFMQLDYFIGLNGMNTFAVFLYSLPALFYSNPFNSAYSKKIAITALISVIALQLGVSFWRFNQTSSTVTNQKTVRIRLVQPAISQTEKQDNLHQEASFKKLLDLTTAAPQKGKKVPDIIIWPETASPYFLDYNKQALNRIGQSLQSQQVLLTGAIRVTRRPNWQISQVESADNDTSIKKRYKFFNSMMLINSNGQITAHSDKVHLVPFGEYLPLQNLFDYFKLDALAQAASAGPYSSGETHHPLSLPGNITALPLICYEAIFPKESVSSAPTPANIIINITNDAWFGNTPGPRQHLAQARLRAVEQHMPLIRVANNGISAYIDAYGRLLASIPYNKSGFLDIDIPASP